MDATDEHDHGVVHAAGLVVRRHAQSVGHGAVVALDRLEHEHDQRDEDDRDPRAFAEADLSFHFLVAKATGNPVVMKVNAIIADILKVSMYGIVESLGPKDGLYYHRKILDAIIDRDVPLAETLMEEHIERTIRRLKRKRDEDRVPPPERAEAKPDELKRTRRTE